MTIGIRHLVVHGSSQGLLGRNVTTECNHLRTYDNRPQLPVLSHVSQDHLSMVEAEMHSNVLLDRFIQRREEPTANPNELLCLVENISENFNNISNRSIEELSHIVCSVHDHACGHFTYGDMKIILKPNKLWKNDVENILQTVVRECSLCIAAFPPKAMRKIYISGINKHFNELVFVDHFCLDDVSLVHFLDSY